MGAASAIASFRLDALPGEDFVQTACRRIAEEVPLGSPDAAALTILVPDLHGVQSVAIALRAAFAVPELLLPRITTLRAWADEYVPHEELVAPARREAELYHALAERQWLTMADLWSLAAELGTTFDELTRWRVSLPQSAHDLRRRLHAAYQAGARASFGFEARLIHELWHAGHRSGALDCETAYGVRLALLAESVGGPIYALALERAFPLEEEFLRRCATRVAVTCLRVDHRRATSALGRTLALAWPAERRVDLVERARSLRLVDPRSPLAGRLQLFAANGAEQEAQAIDLALRRRLQAGLRNIGVVIFDRVVARRARALLERAQILVRDEAGWALSTTSAATVVWRWLDALSNDFYYRDTLDLLKSPFVFHDHSRSDCAQTVWRFERALRLANVHSGIADYRRISELSGDRLLGEVLERLARAEQIFAIRRKKSLSAWIDRLQRSLAEIGVVAGLAADAAGSELLELLESLKADLDADFQPLSFSEWRRWLARQLENANFRDRDIESPVVFTTLAATRLRQFDAVIIVGGDAAHLPGSDRAGLFFNQGVRRELGLPTRSDWQRACEEQLISLLISCNNLLLTWQRTRNGEENLLSPVFERLTALHDLTWGDTLLDHDLAAELAAYGAPSGGLDAPAETLRPAPRITADLAPSAISASAHGSLLACPYQFHARYVLKLAAIDEVQEEIGKVDFGTLLHAVLGEFHRANPLVGELGPAVATQRLEEITRRRFHPLIGLDYQASAWLARWLELLPRYIQWQIAHEADGWRFLAAEVDRSLAVTTPRGRSFILRGRIDRVDQRADGAVTVLDYKTTPADRLRLGLRCVGEDVQLPIYALLWGGDALFACYLSLDRDEIVRVGLDAEMNELVRGVRARLERLYDEIAAGAPMPANGADAVCQYCDVRGLCRKDYWS